MLNETAFEQWCHQLELSAQARDLITRIRSSPPSRLVQSAAGNVSGRYPSQKMACSIQFESRRGELALIYQLEHDPEVLAYYDQPGVIKLTYQSKNDRRVGALHTPDFFVLRSNEAGWIESKMEDRLIQLAEEMPHRYVRNSDGSWSCPPGEAYAKPLGLFYRIHSSAQIDWVYQRNLRFLEDYLRGPTPSVSESVMAALRTIVMSQPGISLLDLLHSLHGGTADDIYFLVITDQLYVDLSRTPLTEPEQVQIFLDRQIAEAYANMRPPPALQLPRPFVLSIAEGTQLCWDGKPWTVLNVGETAVTLLSEDKRVKPIPHAVFDLLLQQGMLTGISSQVESDRRAEERQRLERASPKHLEVATERYRALGKHMPPPGKSQVSLRTLQRWKANLRQAEAAYGNGYVGLLPDWGNCGNRTPRLSQEVETLLEQFIAEHYESLKQQPKKEVYLLLEHEAERQHLPVPSYTTFLLRIKRRSRYEQTLKREGPRAAAAEEAWLWELEVTTPPHGERPWDVVHLDHTQLDIGLVSARTGRYLGKPWATFMTDAFTRRLPVVYLTFDPPSYRSCLMALRECVWRYGRFPQMLVVDGGSDFRSTYFETLLAYYGCTKATRPWAKPRYGSVCERLFGTANTEFVFNLIGNTQIMKQVRRVTKSITPREQAVWSLGDLYAYLTCWAYEVYDQDIHPALGMSPRDAFKAGIFLSGKRAHLKILYNDDFRFLSLATTRKGAAKVEPGRGVRVNYLYYWSEAFRDPRVEETQVPIRYDPFNLGIAFAYVQGRWVQMYSEYYLQLPTKCATRN
jgi:transposase InsO family protein